MRHMPSANRALLKRLCDQYQEMIVWQARRRLPPQEVEDVFYVVVERLMLHLPQIDGLSERQQRVYVYSTTRSVIADWYRQSVGNRQVVPLDDVGSGQLADRRAGPEEIVIRREQQVRMKRLCDQLPPEQRLLLELKYTQELDDGEIGEQLGLSREAVRQRLCRLRKKLRDSLKEV